MMETMGVAARRIKHTSHGAAFTSCTGPAQVVGRTSAAADSLWTRRLQCRGQYLAFASPATASEIISRRYFSANRPNNKSNRQRQTQGQQEEKRRRFRENVSLAMGSSSSLGGGPQSRMQVFGNNNDGDEPSSSLSSSSSSPQSKPPKKQYGSDKKKKKKSKKNKIQLYRADRVLANRSGKTRSECFKLLTKYAISIVDDDDDDNVVDTNDGNNDGSSDDAGDISQLKFRRLKGPKERIPMTARLFINQKFEVPSLPPILTVFHKPKWVLSTMGVDAKERRNLQGLSFPFATQMHPVGRLDYDSSGLLLFSSSGPLTQTLLHPKHEKEKEYVAIVAGRVIEDELQAQLQSGVELVDLSFAAKKDRRAAALSSSTAAAAYADASSDDESNDATPTPSTTSSPRKATFTTRASIQQVKHWPLSDVGPYLEGIRKNMPSEYNVTDLKIRGYLDVFEAEELSEVRLVVQEGKYRMVRRLLASCGHPVVALKRERMGIIELGDLKEGSFRNLTADEEVWAKSLVQ